MKNNELVEKSTDFVVTSSLPEVPDNFESPIANSCENCKQPLLGPFCGQCGQQAESTLKYFWVVIMHLLDDIFSFDSRASRTIFPLVVRPGFLTNEYIAGRRVHYVPPLRLYLFISIVFFITLNFFIAAEKNNILNVNINQPTRIEIKEHITLLENKQLEVIKTSPDKISDLLTIKNDIAKFSMFLADMNKDYSLEENKNLINMTRSLVDLELEKFNENEPLSDKDKTRFELLTSNIVKFKSGEDVDIDEKSKPVVVSDLTFDFLAEDTNKKLTAFANNLASKAEKAFSSDITPLVQQVTGKLPQMMFVLLPLFAVLLKIMFMFSKRLYMEHLTVALHSHSFIFFTILLIELLDVFYDYSETSLPSLTGIIEFAMNALLIWIPIYLFIMQKRIYKQGYFFTFIKYAFIGIAYLMLIGLTGVIAFIWGLTDIKI
jgi:hypothetical protein